MYSRYADIESSGNSVQLIEITCYNDHELKIQNEVPFLYLSHVTHKRILYMFEIKASEQEVRKNLVVVHWDAD